MRREQTKQTLKLRLLAFVLALLLIWYSLNPAPRPVTRIRLKDDLPDEKKREVEPRSLPVALPLELRRLGETAKALPPKALPPAREDEDDFEWPEFIDG